MRHTSIRRFVTSFILTLGIAAAWSVVFAQNAQQDSADTERFIKALEISAGSVVGEIGAGDGTLTLAMAKAVGDEGRVFTNDLNKERMAGLEKAATNAGLKNVTVVEGREAETNFPDQCCDAIFMRNVYHHFGDPPAMNASLLKSLKPGGRLAIIDFGPPPGAESANPSERGKDGHHGVTTPTVERELKAAGFEIISSQTTGRSVWVVARRPQTDTLCAQ
jgi:ubiquinone/menaquinone biosynthesis C-methylase UbiE